MYYTQAHVDGQTKARPTAGDVGDDDGSARVADATSPIGSAIETRGRPVEFRVPCGAWCSANYDSLTQPHAWMI